MRAATFFSHLILTLLKRRNTMEQQIRVKRSYAATPEHNGPPPPVNQTWQYVGRSHSVLVKCTDALIPFLTL